MRGKMRVRPLSYVERIGLYSLSLIQHQAKSAGVLVHSHDRLMVVTNVIEHMLHFDIITDI